MPELTTRKGFRERPWSRRAALLHVEEVRHQLPREDGVVDHAVEDGAEEQHVAGKRRSNADGSNGPQENEQRVQRIGKAELHRQ